MAFAISNAHGAGGKVRLCGMGPRANTLRVDGSMDDKRGDALPALRA